MLQSYYGNIVKLDQYLKQSSKIYATSPLIDKAEYAKTVPTRIQNSIFDNHYTKSTKENKSMPDLRGMEAMDAVALPENPGARVTTKNVSEPRKAWSCGTQPH
jgi:cell division protein FtsI (penicillin-binding protein 3)